MACTYTQIHIQCIMAVKFRESLIERRWKTRLHRFVTRTVQRNGHKVIAVNTMPDHLHLLFEMNPNQSLSALMKSVQEESSKWINKQKLSQGLFKWQEGYGAFSYERSQIKKVAEQIINHEEYHKKKSFLKEYESFINQFEIGYHKQYIFKPLE